MWPAFARALRAGPLPLLLLLLLLPAPARGSGSGTGDDCVARMVQGHGYPLEVHQIKTGDGYLLTAFRIPHGVAWGGPWRATGRPPVLLQHALLCSAFDYVNNGPKESLAFLLADAGFDVWLGNNRGNTWGRNHTSLPVDSKAFWDFSWDDMALSDLPAHIDHVLRSTGFSKLSYVGHSEGTIQAFAGFSTNAEVASKVNLFIALAPVAYVHYQGSAVLSLLATFRTGTLLHMLGFQRFLTTHAVINKFASQCCSLFPNLCNDFLFLLCGHSTDLNRTRLPVYLSETPAGTSVKNMVHWAQGVRRSTFSMFDYGCASENQAKYNRSTPPLYNLSSMTVKTALFTGGNDILADQRDVKLLLDTLPLASVVYHQHDEQLSHLDFAWGESAHTKVYPKVIELLKTHVGQILPRVTFV